MEKYNGWTNYATWRVNLEIFDGFDMDSLVSFDMKDLYNLTELVEGYATDWIIESSESGLARDYALAFLQEVNWKEIAQALVDNYAEENESC
jgi:multimeric flavodoxin WrbA